VITALKVYVHADRARSYEAVDIPTELDMILALYVEPDKGISVTRAYEGEAHVRGVPDALGQVWTNLLVNAVQAMGGRGSLAVRVSDAGSDVAVEIEDDGPGIPPEISARVFEPFFTTKPRGQGSGLGLDIARRIVEEHGGRISFESRPGRTLFKVLLPSALPPSAVKG
jgi:signal transduction histidine kinase